MESSQSCKSSLVSICAASRRGSTEFRFVVDNSFVAFFCAAEGNVGAYVAVLPELRNGPNAPHVRDWPSERVVYHRYVRF